MTITVAVNGLAYTSVAEVAGPAWAGRALGAQNTGQFIAASMVGPCIGALIGVGGYALTFAIVAAFPPSLCGWYPELTGRPHRSCPHCRTGSPIESALIDGEGEHRASSLVSGLHEPMGFAGRGHRVCAPDGGDECVRRREAAEKEEVVRHLLRLRQAGEHDCGLLPSKT